MKTYKIGDKIEIIGPFSEVLTLECVEKDSPAVMFNPLSYWKIIGQNTDRRGYHYSFTKRELDIKIISRKLRDV